MQYFFIVILVFISILNSTINLFAVQPAVQLVRMVANNNQSPFSGLTVQSNFSPDNDNNQDYLILKMWVTNTNWHGGSVEVIVDINQNGQYETTDWIQTGYLMQNQTNWVVWDGYNTLNQGSDGNYQWIVPNGIYNIRTRICDTSNPSNTISGNITTNFANAAPNSGVLSGMMTITGSTNTAQVSVGYNNRYSKPVKSGQQYSVYGLQKNNNYRYDNVRVAVIDLPSASAYSIYKNDQNLDLTSGSNNLNLSDNGLGKTFMSGNIIDYLSGDKIANTYLGFSPTSGHEADTGEEQTSGNANGFYSDYYRGNGWYNYSIAQSGYNNNNSPYGTIMGNYYINSNLSPITQNFYLGLKGSISVQINPPAYNVQVQIQNANTGQGIGNSFPSDQNGLATTSNPFGAGVYTIMINSFSNTNTHHLYASMQTNVALIDRQNLLVSVTPSVAYKIYGTVRTNGVGINNIEVDAFYSNNNPISQNGIGANSDGSGNYLIQDRNNNPFLFTPGYYKISAGIGVKGPSPYKADQKIVNVTSSNMRIDLNLTRMTNKIILVFTNWSKYTQGGNQVGAFGSKHPSLISGNKQNFIGQFSSVTTTVIVDSATNTYDFLILAQQQGSGPGYDVAFSYTNHPGNIAIIRDKGPYYSLSGLVKYSNSNIPVSGGTMLILTMSSQLAYVTGIGKDGTFKITNITQPGPYIIPLNGAFNSGGNYRYKTFNNIPANSSVTLQLVSINTVPPEIKFLTPPANTEVKTSGIRFFVDDGNGPGIKTNSIKVQWVSGTGPDFGVRTIGTGLAFSNGWVIYNGTGLGNGTNTIQISVADISQPPNTNRETFSYIINTIPPVITVASFTDMNGTHDNVFGNSEWNLNMTIKLAGNKSGNYSMFIDNNHNGVYDPAIDWYLTDANGNLANALTYSNSMINNNYNSAQFNFAYNPNSIGHWNDLSDGKYNLVVQLDDSVTASVNDGNRIQTNLVFYKDTQIPIINTNKTKTINTNTVVVSFGSNTVIDKVTGAAIQFFAIKSTNIVNNQVFFTITPNINSHTNLKLTLMNILDRGNNNYFSAGTTPIRDGINPTLYLAKTIASNKIQFTFNEAISNVNFNLLGRTATSINYLQRTNIIYTISSNFFGPAETGNYSITIHDLGGNTNTYSGTFVDGISPRVLSFNITRTNSAILYFNEPLNTLNLSLTNNYTVAIVSNFITNWSHPNSINITGYNNTPALITLNYKTRKFNLNQSRATVIASNIFDASLNPLDTTHNQAIETPIIFNLAYVHNRTIGSNYSTIASALTKANSGNLIEVDLGVYNESVLIKSLTNITLRPTAWTQSGNNTGTIITGNGSLPNLILITNSSGNKIIGFTIEQSTSAGIRIVGNSVSNYVQNNNIFSNSKAGIQLDINSWYNRIKLNKLFGANQGSGIYIGPIGANNNSIYSNLIFGNKTNGIFLSGVSSTNNVIKANQIYSNLVFGINNTANNNSILSNKIYVNQKNGILINAGNNEIISANLITKNGTTGIAITNSIGSSLTYNILTNQSQGLSINNSTVQFQLNLIKGNATGLKLGLANTLNETKNNIFANLTNVKAVSSAKLTNIWWGSVVSSNIQKNIVGMSGYSNFTPYRLFGAFDLTLGAITDKLPTITWATATSFGKTITLKWRKPSSVINFSKYVVYNSLVPGYANLSSANLIFQTNNVNGTNYNLTITPNQTNYYFITSRDNTTPYTNESWYSPQVKIAVLLPARPTWTSVSEPTIGKVALQWVALSNTTSYTLFSALANLTNAAAKIQGLPGTVTTATDLTESPGVRNYYWLKAYNSVGASAYSVSTNILTKLAAPGSFTVVPTVTYTKTNTILNWNSVVGENGYEIRTNLASGTLTPLGPTITIYTDKTVKAGQVIKYYVRATNALINSTWSSNTVEVLPIIPSQVSNTTFSNIAFNSLILKWQSSSSFISKYIVYTNQSGKTNKMLTTINSYAQIPNLSANSLYSFVVKASNLTGVSSNYSASAFARTAYTPALLSAINCTVSTNIAVTWKSIGATGYNIYLATNTALNPPAGWNLKKSATTNIALKSIAYGKLNYIWVIGTNNNSNPLIYNNYTNYLRTSITPVSPLTNLSITVLATNKTILQWNDTSGETSYAVTTNNINNIRTNLAANTTAWTDHKNYKNRIMNFYVYGSAPNSTSISSTIIGSYNVPNMSTLSNRILYGPKVRLAWNKVAYGNGFIVMTNILNSSAILAKMSTNITLFTDKAISSGITRKYFLVATNSLGWSAVSTNTVTIVGPGTPIWNNIANLSVGKVRLQWNAIANETSATLFRSLNNNNTNAAINLIGFVSNILMYTDSMVSPGQRYYYWLRSYNTEAPSPYSLSTNVITILANPSNFYGQPNISGAQTNAIFSWKDVVGEAGYQIRTNLITGTLLHTTMSNITKWTDSTIKAGMTRTYYLRATNSFAQSIWDTNIVSMAKPRKLVFTSVVAPTFNQVNLQWNLIPSTTSYSLYRATTTNAASTNNVGGSTNNTFIDLSVQNGLKYYYWIKSFNAFGNSGFTNKNISVVTPLPGPANFKITAGLNFSADLSWNVVANALGYKIMANNIISGFKQNLPASTSSWTDNTVVAGLTTIYYIKATNAWISSSWVSNSVSIPNKSALNLETAKIGPTVYKGSGYIHFQNLTPSVNIKIFSISGALVADLKVTSPDGKYQWDTKGTHGLLGSGVYIVRIENGDNASDNKVFKIIILR